MRTVEAQKVMQKAGKMQTLSEKQTKSTRITRAIATYNLGESNISVMLTFL